MAMSVSSETTFFSMKLQPEICPQLRTGRIDTSVHPMILKLLITRGNITLIPKEATEEKEKENNMIEKEENNKKETKEKI